MKQLIFPWVAAGCMLVPTLVFSQSNADSTGLPGDSFDLQGAMELFKHASSIESFEQSLNTQSNDVNNLDLNGDDQTDYVQVNDRVDGTSHAIVMQVAVNASEMQDVAVIMLEKTGDSTAHMQIVGNEELYGSETVMEPYDEVAEKTTTGPSAMFAPMRIIIVNVWGWPAVRYIYRPAYIVYVSPWSWGYYPVWWSPWRPVYWRTHWAHVHRYHAMYYHPASSCYLHHAHGCYMKNKSMSKTVVAKYAAPQANYKMKQQSAAGKTTNAAHQEKTAQHTGSGNKAQSTGLQNKNSTAKNTGTATNLNKSNTHSQKQSTAPRPNNVNHQPAQAAPRPQSHPAPQQRGGNMGGQPRRSAPVNHGGGGGGRQGQGHRR